MREIANRVFRLGADLVNWYVVADGEGLTVIDAGNPNQHAQLPEVVEELGRAIGDVEGIVLTHAHGDHLGSAARFKEETEGDVFVHSGDEALARGEDHRRYERHYVRDLYHGFAWKSLLFFALGGALKASPVSKPSVFADGETLDLPGRPRAIHTPGHTAGSVCLVLEDRGVVFTGDALVTLSILTGETGPMIMPGSFNADSPASLTSIERLRDLSTTTVLPGHGEPWSGPIDDAVDQALAHGPH